jgi:branched-chain amino acid transport system permease protein
MQTAHLLQYLISGLTIGSIYAIVAIGFNIVYNTTGIINFAQGEFVMLGGMSAVSLQVFMPLPLAISAAVALTALAGVAVQLLFISWLDRPSVLRMIVITIGLSILLRETALHIWDEKVRSLPYFTGNEISSIPVLGAHVSPQVLWVLATCALIVAGLTLFFNCTASGKSMRACSANALAAALCGVNTRRVVTLSFLVSAAIGALAGCVISPITHTQYDSGTPLAIKGFTVAIMGGLGNSLGAVGAGLILGALEALSTSVLPLAYKDAVCIAILLAILFFRPGGLFGNRETLRLKAF